MLIHEFPDIHWLKSQIQSRFENQQRWDGLPLSAKGWPTVVLNANAQNIVRDQVIGPLSFFTNLSGKSKAMAGNREVEISRDVFFLSNASEPYTLVMKQPVETFNIHVGEQISREIFQSLSQTHASLIDQPFEKATLPSFTHQLRWRDQPFNSILSELQQGVDALRESECMAELLFYLLRSDHQLNLRKLSLDATKKSTRDEIARRLSFAVDYIYSHFDQDISLDALAAESCISKFHLVRLFKIFFQATPHQFITQVRIEKAKSLLQQKKGSVKEVARQVGFINSSSFSRLFYQSTGLYPTAFNG
jgi:AraC family transcriptional regulator